MSYSQIPLNLLQSLDCVTDINAPLEYVVQKGGGSDNYYTKYTVNGGSPSTSQNTFNINPNSPNVIIDRRIYLENTYVIKLSASNPPLPVGPGYPQYIFQAGVSGCLRQLPTMSAIKSLSISINDQTFSTNVNDYISAMYKYMSDDLKEFELSTSPTMDDKFQNYADGVGTNLNPMATYGNSGNGVPTRGGFNIQVLSNPLISVGESGDAYLQVTVVEPVMISPLWAGKGSPKGLIGVSTMSLNYVFDNGAKSIWSQNIGQNILPLNGFGVSGPTAGVTINPTGYGSPSAYVWVLQYTPRLVEPIPKEIAWPYSNLTLYPSGVYPINVWPQAGPTYELYNGGTSYVAPSSTLMSVSGINLSTVPERIYIFARQQPTDLSGNVYQSNAYGVINNVTITWDGRNLLSQCTGSQVYEFCVANGCKQNYSAFSDYEGSVVTVDWAKQIGCSSLQAPGLLSRSTLNVTANVSCTSGGIFGQPLINYVLYVVVCESGIAGSIDNHCIKQVGLLSSQDVLDSDKAPYSHDHRDLTVYGSSFLGDLYSGFKKGIGHVYSVAKYIPDAIKVARTVAPLFGVGLTGGRSRSRSHSRKRSNGHGMSGGRSRSRSRSNSRKRHHMHGAGLEEASGGKMLSRKDLLNRKK